MDWRQQPITVMGQPRLLGEIEGGKLYHGTTAILAVGEKVVPGLKSNFKQSPGQSISITSNLSRALFWAKQVARLDGQAPHVYEINPIGTVEGWRVQTSNQGKNIMLWEGRAPAAIVLNEVQIGGFKEWLYQ